MTEQFQIARKLYGHDISAWVTKMPEDIHILLTGGCLPHVGSVSIYKGGAEVSSIGLPGHKDYVIGNSYAKALSQISGFPVTVVCGIHYDNATGPMIEEIVRQTNEMLEEIMENLKP
ncbi:MAG: hypothetical protein QM683_06810 [Lacrimispora sp.]